MQCLAWLKQTVMVGSALPQVEYVDLTSPLGLQPDAESSMKLQMIAVSSKKMRRKAASHSPPQPGNKVGRRKTTG